MLAMGLPRMRNRLSKLRRSDDGGRNPIGRQAAPEKKAAAVVPPKVLTAWRAAIAAHLNQHKRYPGSGAGISTITFSVDRSGKVLSARLLKSSGTRPSMRRPSPWRGAPARCPSRPLTSPATTSASPCRCASPKPPRDDLPSSKR